MMGTARWEAVVLAGGRATRLDGTSKPDLILEGTRLLDRVLEAIAAHARERGEIPLPITVVGPEEPAQPGLRHRGQEHPGITFPATRQIRENPPFGGPAAGLAAALPGLSAEWILLLPCDLEHPQAVLHELGLAGTAEHGSDGVLLCDPDGQPQWLSAVYRRSALLRVLADAPGQRDRSLRDALGTLRLTRREVPVAITRDIDTFAALAAARTRHLESKPQASVPLPTPKGTR